MYKELFMNKEQPKKNTKDLIFETAVELFSKKGVHGTSVRELARDVGIKESSIYNHFPGKDAIFEEILAYYMAGFKSAIPGRDEMEQTASEYSDPVELWLAGITEFLNRIPPLFEKIAGILLNEMFLDERCRKFILHSMFTIQKETTEMLLGDMSARGMIKDCDISKTAEQYVYMLHGLDIENRLLLMDGCRFEDIQKRLVEHIKYFIEQLKL